MYILNLLKLLNTFQWNLNQGYLESPVLIKSYVVAVKVGSINQNIKCGTRTTPQYIFYLCFEYDQLSFTDKER